MTGLDFGHGPLAPDQRDAALAGLNARVQLLQGPPGTGKTQTTAAAALLRILARRAPGDVVLVTGNTHTAVDTLLDRMRSLLPRFGAAVPMPPVHLAKVGTDPTDALAPSAVTVLGGTPSGLLKLAKSLGLSTPLLIVDEASMMALPYFLAVASLVHPDGEILLAGDHRQLAPIMAHDWEREDRPPARLYQPHVSAYEAVRRLKQSPDMPDAAILQSALTYTFRLPPAIRDLIARLYRLDDIELAGRPLSPTPRTANCSRTSGRGCGSMRPACSSSSTTSATPASPTPWKPTSSKPSSPLPPHSPPAASASSCRTGRSAACSRPPWPTAPPWTWLTPWSGSRAANGRPSSSRRRPATRRPSPPAPSSCWA